MRTLSIGTLFAARRPTLAAPVSPVHKVEKVSDNPHHTETMLWAIDTHYTMLKLRLASLSVTQRERLQFLHSQYIALKIKVDNAKGNPQALNHLYSASLNLCEFFAILHRAVNNSLAK